MYNAQVIKVTKHEHHPNADRLDVVYYNGESFICGRDQFTVGDTAIIFPSDGKLLPEFLTHNNLYRSPEKNQDTQARGYFGDNGRVTTEKIRGIPSYGLIMPPKAFEYKYTFDFVPGKSFNTIEGDTICTKYISPNTLRARNLAKHSSKDKIVQNFTFKKHRSTLYLSPDVQAGYYVVTEKLHGTSGRTGYVETTRPTKSLRSFINSLLNKKEYLRITGTRNTVCATDNDGWAKTSSTDFYRYQIHQELSHKLRKGETIYYEIVGYNSALQPIMHPHNPQKVKGNYDCPLLVGTHTLEYAYGVSREDLFPYKVYVYRITQQEHGVIRELTWDQVRHRCYDLEVRHVPELGRGYFEDYETFLSEVQATYLHNSTVSTIDPLTLKEGICIRVFNQNTDLIFKNKTFLFGVLEGWNKEADIVDLEETM